MVEAFQVGPCKVVPDLLCIVKNESALQLEPKAMEVLVFLAEHPEEVLPEDTIIEAVWKDTFVTNHVLSKAIYQLRKAFDDDAKNPQYIQTIPKRGYRLAAEDP